jgi:hypothetical protein
MACSTRVTRVALVDSRFRASQGITGTSGEIARPVRELAVEPVDADHERQPGSLEVVDRGEGVG